MIVYINVYTLRILLVAFLGLLLGALPQTVSVQAQTTFPFQNSDLPLETRIDDLMSRLTQVEKISLLHQWQPAIPRLGIASFRMGTEGLHGVAWLGTATVFPQAIGLGSTWDRDLIKRVGSVVGDEVRAKHRSDPVNVGLSVWAPVVDPLRDPRAGRTEEGYSEDAFLSGQLSIAYSLGLKGDHPFYYKTIPTLKHFYGYNQETNRVTTDVVIDARNKYEYYLEFFRYAIASGAAKSLMTAYNKVNGVPATVISDINSVVKSQWAPIASGSDFFVVTDAYAPANLLNPQFFYSTGAQSHAGMIKVGVDSMTQDGSNTTPTINSINAALSQGLITPADIDRAVRNILRVRFHTGEFDGTRDPYRNIDSSIINSPTSQALAREAVRKSVVLLKNNPNILPLNRSAIDNIAVIGQRGNEVLTDWYSGTLPYSVTPLQGIRNKVGTGVTVNFAADNTNNAAVNIAQAADVAIVFVGNRPQCNGGWAGTCPADEGKETIDRTSINLSSAQETLIQQVRAVNPNTVVVVISSFPYAITWANTNVPAIVHLSHGGQELGNGLADVLLGDYNPAGRLTMTWYSSLSQLPALTSYDIINGNRTYMYFTGTPLYPFGHGLSYSTFQYSNLRLSANNISTTQTVTVSVDVANTGTLVGDEVVQLYVRDVQASVKRPGKELLGFERINIPAGQMRTVNFLLPASELAFWNTSANSFFVEPGSFSIMVGSSSMDIRLTTTLNVGTVVNPTLTATATRTNTQSAPTNTPVGITATRTPTRTSTRTNTPLSPTVLPTIPPTTPPTTVPTSIPPTTGASTLKVQYKAADTVAGDNQFKPHFNIVNTGSTAVALSSLKIRYYFTKDGGGSPVFNCDWAVVGCGNVTGTFVAITPAKTNADYYLEVGFTGTGTIAAGGQAGEIQTRNNKSDWTNFNEANDYSFDATRISFGDYTKVTLYKDGVLVWGVVP